MDHPVVSAELGQWSTLTQRSMNGATPPRFTPIPRWPGSSPNQSTMTTTDQYETASEQGRFRFGQVGFGERLQVGDEGGDLGVEAAGQR